ncbi:MAG TPA: autotransporter-associated beta strand repeat-containing protein [Verrucomicrobiae bacterium]|nr:autotransporter-associated beta strand repeat-containing protein [Verrucomicrobiae bacterium]
MANPLVRRLHSLFCVRPDAQGESTRRIRAATGLRHFIAAFLSAGLAITLSDPTRAATTFSWTVTGGYYGAASGSWNTSTNWSPSGPANGSDNTADFSQVFFENPSTVTLDGTFTIGNLHFGDTKGAGHAWYLETGSGGPLTLSVSSSTPTITVDNQQAATINAGLAGTSFSKSGLGTLTLGGASANTLTGDTTVAGGTLILYKSAGPALGGNLILTGSGTAGTVVSDVIQSNDNQLVDTAVVTINSTIGTYAAWELRGFSQTVAGIADNGQGQIEISDAGTESVGNSTLTLNGSATYTFSGRLREHNDLTPGGSLSLVKNGPGTQILNGQHIQYAGSTTVNQGRLILGNTANFGSVTTNNATIELTTSGSFSFQGAAPIFCGTGTVVKTGPDTIYLGYIYQPGQGGAIFSMGTNGWIDIEAGTLRNLNRSGNWTNNQASLKIASGAVLDMDANSVWVDALTGGGTIIEEASPQSQILTVGVAGGSGAFSGVVQNTGSPMVLVKVGTGRQTLSGANTYGGGTIISNGTLLIDNAIGSGTGTGAVTVVGGATLGGTGVISGPVNLGPAAVLRPGDPVGSLTVNNNLVFNNASVLQYGLGTNSSQLIVNGNLTLGGTLNVTDSGNFSTGTYVLITYSGTLTNHGLGLGATPNPGLTYAIDTSTSGLVKLIVTGPTESDPYSVWQQRYFHCTDCPQAAGDADPLGKGMSNTNQFLAGLDPTNSASLFRIVSAVCSATDMIVTWQTGGGRTNVVQASSGQPDSGYTNTFQDIASIIIPGMGDVTTNYTDVGGATNGPSRYYRVRLGP